MHALNILVGYNNIYQRDRLKRELRSLKMNFLGQPIRVDPSFWDVPKDGSALTGREGTWAMATSWLVKTKSGVCCCLRHLAPLQGASPGGRRFLGFRFAASAAGGLSSCRAFGA
jgi:hypothetical protein